MDTQELDFTKLRYVIYARKSTDDPQRQVRSIPDQIAECRQLAVRLRLHIIEPPIVETRSAKRPGKRPLFRQMLNDIRAGKIDGIISWHPDRLARNMKEGGEIIDMVDERLIKDMKFVTQHFSTDANGKMLLGMAFVLSKQYSDNLSQNVTRGVRRNFAEGKSPAPKHGYVRDESGHYQPDGKNFELIQKAWQMRKEGISLEDITEFMDSNGYGRVIKSTGHKVKMTKQTLSDIFRDPIYYGILIQLDQQVDLRSIYDFTPAISEQDYIEVQMLSNRRVSPYKKRSLTYLPLKLMVDCAFCGSHMYAGVSKGHFAKYLYYRCDNKSCPRKKRSIRSKIVFDFIYELLRDGLNFTEADYHKYYGGLVKLSQIQHEKLLVEIHSKQGMLKKTDLQIKDLSYKLVDLKLPPLAKKINEERLTDLEAEKQQLETEIAKLKQKVTDPDKERISIEQFLNLSKNAGRIIQAGDGVVKDAICRLIFLNFSVDESKVLSYRLKEPFATLLKTRSVVTSRG